jgi:hypothetical protein
LRFPRLLTAFLSVMPVLYPAMPSDPSDFSYELLADQLGIHYDIPQPRIIGWPRTGLN